MFAKPCFGSVNMVGLQTFDFMVGDSRLLGVPASVPLLATAHPGTDAC